MILGVGLDLVPVHRMERTLHRHGSRALSKLFTPLEVRSARERGSFARPLAARFAAKEAFFKALGTGWGRGGRWTEVEVVSAPSGSPSLRLHGAARAAAERAGVGRMHLSLSHTEELAAAFLLLQAAPLPSDSR